MSDLPHAEKSLGQHWLTDKATLKTIVQEAGIAQDDVVLEIGPGTGTLTKVLLGGGAHVTAVEFDQNLIASLEQNFPNIDIEQSDILTFDFSKLPSPYKVVANIPYYLTSKLLRVLSETNNSPELAVLLIQKEVAERVCAQPGKMSLLSVSAQYYWNVSLGVEVPARLFTPPPKVDSQTVILERREKPLFGKIDEKKFFRVAKAGFSNRRKTLLNSLSAGFRLTKDATRELLEVADIKPTARPQELSLKEWYQLYQALD